MSLGANIKRFRKLRGFTQEMLARKANMSRSYLADVERDRYNPSVDTLKAIAGALNVGVNDLIDALDEPVNNPVPGQLTPKEERDIAKDLERIMENLESDNALAFHGEPLDEETKRLLQISLENSLRLAKELAKKKFSPHKYKK
ncbi:MULTISPECIES: helix-turn-helix domain-containing protein [Brevibacillus]|jgi:transcriptional regulator with XRE-family HTH domain|uniref:helix-turn-helix domain-containing protein n=1 Tax=Brevibacillus TaxID=55080 RepID=UPI001490C46A|nr:MULTISPECIES: helix-turn-helix transcriptional regulator [Brevibacillus]MBR8659575.1 helix-turn-helix transcriptional regulator [Brevibacillus sp. NL20B1]MDT3415608.1 transcriptional regulator with XRE-family HTH domain [Brevibacillus aydinogluensis]NNV01930.1 XRE family transcriptional regulator [Brevibacillus sp. MCWH]